MKKFFRLQITAILLLSLVFVSSLFPKGSSEVVSENQYYGTKSPYPVPVDVKYTKAPAGYEASFIYLLNRHGSRNLSSFKYDKTWLELLSIAEEEGQLTEQGKKLKVEIQKIADWEVGKYGLLTSSGASELYNIGKRTGENFEELFKTGAPIFADSTYIERTSETRDSFMEGLRTTGYNGQVTTVTYEENADTYLRPLDIATKYIEFKDNGPWIEEHEKYSENETAREMARRVCSQFFTQPFLERLDSGEFQLEDIKGKVKLNSIATATTNLYECYIILPALKADGLTDVDLRKYFEADELKMFESIQSAKSFFTYGPGNGASNGIAMSIMAPSVKRMINVVDSHLSGDSPYLGVFSFAHGETIIPLINMLEIEDANIPNDDLAEAGKTWRASYYGPMAANVKWVIYTAPGKEPLLKVMLHEKESSLSRNLKPFKGPYYKWSDVKDYYSQKIGNLGITLDSTFEENIESLKKDF